jgi:rhodanese-related sulfurtransferase
MEVRLGAIINDLGLHVSALRRNFMTLSISIPVTITPVEVDSLRKSASRLTLIDVRSPAEFASAHIPGSFNVPLDLLPRHRGELEGIAGPIVLVCLSGQRAHQAEAFLREGGIEQCQVLTGGMKSWESSGLEVNRGKEHWSLERQVRAIAGSLVLLGTLGSLLIWSPLIFLAVFVGGGLLFAGVTDTCLMGIMLMRLPYNRGPSSNVQNVIAQLRERRSPATV